MSEHNIAQVVHLLAEPEGGYHDNSPVRAIYLDGRVESTWWGRDAVMAWRAEKGDAAATAFTPPPITVEHIVAERERRLALGFDFDFEDVRGVHRIGTTGQDMIGWDEVSKFSQAAINLGLGSVTINIVTNTGPVAVTALEWQQILVAAAAARQPLWAASFVLQAASPIPADYREDSYWQEVEAPE
jgi:hypothetical protein